MKALGAILLAVSMSSMVGADEIHLLGGGKISGEIVERSAERIVVETGPGRVTIPMSRVTKVQTGHSALREFRERARVLQPGDAAGWVALGRWADERDLGTQAREAYQRALALDPDNAAANAALGRALVDGRWLSQEESYRAQGLVPFEGAWVTPAEREAARRERSEAGLSERAEREAEARVREAEARARAAEAEARRAEAEAATQEPSGEGIPYWPYVYGGGVLLPPRDPSCCRPAPEPRPTPTPPPRRPPPSSLNGAAEDKPSPPAAPQPAPIAPIPKR
jgi:hypothetical protein